MLGEAATNFARCAGRPEPDLSDAAGWLSQSDMHRLPLFAGAAAMHAVLEPNQAFGIDAPELLRDLAKRERRRVRKASEACGLGKVGLERLLALGVLGDGLSESAVRELGKSGVCDGPAQDPVAALVDTPWWHNGRLLRLQPDRPAAAFLDAALFNEQFPTGPDKLPDWLFIAAKENAGTFADRLGRILFDLDILNSARRGPHPLDDRLIDMLRAAPDRAGAFVEATQLEPSFQAARFAAEVAAIWVAAIADPAGRAGLLNNLANMLSAVGRREDGLAAAEEAVALYRELARARPDAFTPHLAGSLTTLANMRSYVGRREDALAAAEEAVALRRELARARPDAFTPDLAMSLNNLANRLSDVGRREDALAAAEEAVALRRELARARPDAFTPDLAGALNNLANRLSDVGRREDALAIAEEAVALRRELARARPDAFTPDLAMSLNNLAARLSDVGRREDALAAAEEAVAFRRELARARPDAFTPDLAGSLNNLANSLSDVGRREDSLAAAEEAVALRRELACARPDAFTPDLAMSLNNLANRLSDVGRREDALAAAEEAVALRRELARARPDAFTPNLAGSLK